jgi:hypothetical protein
MAGFLTDPDCTMLFWRDGRIRQPSAEFFGGPTLIHSAGVPGWQSVGRGVNGQ